MTQTQKVMAIASAGGHLVQLLRLSPAWQGCSTVVVTTSSSYEKEVRDLAEELGQEPPDFAFVTEANRWQKLRLLRATVDLMIVLLKFRPDVIITTGAAPGYIAMRLGGLLGARTAWIDSIANAGQLSLSGEKAGRHAGLWLTQWEHLARPDGPSWKGSVL